MSPAGDVAEETDKPRDQEAKSRRTKAKKIRKKTKQTKPKKHKTLSPARGMAGEADKPRDQEANPPAEDGNVMLPPAVNMTRKQMDPKMRKQIHQLGK